MAEDKKKDGTERIPITPEMKKKAQTSRVNLGAAREDAEDTTRIVMPDDQEESTRIALPGDGSDTSRVDPAADTVEAKTEGRPATPPVARPPATPPPAAKKSQTQRISLSAARPAETAPASREGLKNETMRVQVDDIKKSETSKVAAPAPAVVGQPGSTQRFELKSDPEEEDAFKRHLPPGEQPPAKARPRTVRIKRKPSADSAAVASVAAAAGLPAPEDETVAEAAPPEAPPAEAAPAAAPAAPKGKSQTARIDLPPEVAAGRPKTIKIKRSEGPAPAEKPAATPAKPSSATAKAAAKAPKLSAAMTPLAQAGPGPLFSVIAIAAVLAVCVLIYMLLAQTFVPSLPFPGKLGV